MNASLRGDEAKLLAYYRLDDNSNTIADGTGSGYTGAFLNSGTRLNWLASTAPIDTVHALPLIPTPITLAGFDALQLPMTFSVVTNPLHGIISGSSPVVLYTPDGTYAGTDSFTYQATDALRSGTAALVKINYGSSATLSGTVTLQDCVAPQSQTLTFQFRPTDGTTIFNRTATLDNTGGYSIALLPKRSYNVWIKGLKWLARVIAADVSAANVTNGNVTLRAGDASNDNAVDISDLLLLVAAYNQVSPAAGYSNAADFNCDGSNDITDLLLLIGNYNQLGDP